MKHTSANFNHRKPKLFKSALLTLLFTFKIILISVTAQHTLTIDDVTFNATTGTITDYLSDSVNIIIPASFNINGSDVGVTIIEYQAFYKNSLTSVTIPNSVTTIGGKAFYANSLTSVIIPNSVTTIGWAAFNINAITQINGVASNGIIYARNSDGTEDNTTIVSYGGVAVDIDFIPNSVTTFGYYAFGSNDLTSVITPNSVTTIGDYAFVSNDLTSVIIPNSVTTIEYRAFAGNSLRSVTFEQNSFIRLIGMLAFSNNANLTCITLPTNANSGFSGYKEMNGNSYNSGDSITDVGRSYYAVLPTHTLTFDDVEFEEGEIVDYFGGYVDIIIPQTFNINGSDVSVTTIGRAAFSRITLTNVSIPNSVTMIGRDAFRYNSLTSVAIPNSVKAIGSNAFYGNSLTSITLPAPVIKEGYTFREWQNGSGTVVIEITNFETSYEAQFTVITVVKEIETMPVNIYPNPVSSILTIKLAGSYNSLQIINLTGTVLKTVDCTGLSTLQTDMSHLMSGVYIIKLSGKEGAVIKKIVKQ